MHDAKSATVREDTRMRLLRTSHLGPTLLVTLVAYLLAIPLWRPSSALVIALAVFTGQLCIGWTNDLVDLENDRTQRRKNKPLASGELLVDVVVRATYISLGSCILLSLFGPLGIRGGLVHLLGVGCGISYNFYFKRTWLSPLPYLIAFAALPSCIVLSKKSSVPLWLVFAGAIFGIAAHFSNVLKDMEPDRAAGILGAPQILGTRISLLITGSSLIAISIILTSVTHKPFLIPVAFIAMLFLFLLPKKFSFPLIMTMAIVDVSVLVTAGAASLALPH
jgi:4-hydroxybenzoate polyprenyltransferase